MLYICFFIFAFNRLACVFPLLKHAEKFIATGKSLHAGKMFMVKWIHSRLTTNAHSEMDTLTPYNIVHSEMDTLTPYNIVCFWVKCIHSLHTTLCPYNIVCFWVKCIHSLHTTLCVFVLKNAYTHSIQHCVFLS